MSKTRHGIMYLHCPVKLKLERWRMNAFLMSFLDILPCHRFETVTGLFYVQIHEIFSGKRGEENGTRRYTQP